MSRIYDIINSLDVGKDWKLTFKKIHLCYYKNYYHGQQVFSFFWTLSNEAVSLPFSKKMQLFVKFNPLGFIFGPLYYIYKGLLLKGFILLIISTLILLQNNEFRFLIFLILLYCATYINFDYYIKKVINHDEIKKNPLMLDDGFDYDILEKLLVTKTSFIPYVILIILLSIPVLSFLHRENSNNNTLKELVVVPKIICTSKAACNDIIKRNLTNINSTQNKKDISDYYYEMAHAYYSIDDKYNAIRVLDLSLDFNKNNINSLLLKARIEFLRNEYAGSLLDYKEALKQNPKAKFLNYYIGLNFYQLKKYENALKYFDLVPVKYQTAAFFEARGYSKHARRDIRGAVSDLKKAKNLYQNSKKEEKIKKLDQIIQKLEQQL